MPKAVTEIRSLARSHTRTALNVLVGVMRSNEATPAARVAEHAILAQVHHVVYAIISKFRYLPGGPMGPSGFFSFYGPKSKSPVADSLPARRAWGAELRFVYPVH
jgi:hypothetical protein